MVKIVMHGCLGHMGQTVCRLIEADPACELVAGIDARAEASSESFPVFDEAKKCDMPADVIIDFSHQEAVDSLIDFAIDKKIPLVICTTALKEETLIKIDQASKVIPIFKSANMSLGVNLLSNLLQKVSHILYEENFDIEVIEKHHNLKVDAPSGTAFMLADAINRGLDNQLTYVFDRSQKMEKRTKSEIGIHAVRGGTIVGEHEVLFAGKDEVLRFEHTAYSKEVFAVGAIKAAKFVSQQKPGMYDMNALLSQILG